MIYHPLVTAGGYPAQTAMYIFEALCAMTAVVGVVCTTPGQTQLCRAEAGSGLRLGQIRQGGKAVAISLLVQVMILLTVLVGITHPVFGFNPREVIRTSWGQPYGGRNAEGGSCMAAREESFWGGYTRRRSVCRDDDSAAQQVRTQATRQLLVMSRDVF